MYRIYRVVINDTSLLVREHSLVGTGNDRKALGTMYLVLYHFLMCDYRRSVKQYDYWYHMPQQNSPSQSFGITSYPDMSDSLKIPGSVGSRDDGRANCFCTCIFFKVFCVHVCVTAI